MFTDCKYTRLYYAIITSAKTRNISIEYCEKHHIIPKSLGGDNSKDNLVELTYREHFICHMLLTKMTIGDDKRKMACALWAMTRKTGKRSFSSRQYHYARLIYIQHHPNGELNVGVKRERAQKVSRALKGRVLPHQSKNLEAHNRAVSEGKIDNPRTKTWVVTTPTGEILQIRNLAKFCRDNSLSKGSLCGSGRSKGFTAKHLD